MAPPPIPPAGSLRLRVLNLFTRLNVIVYRASGGRLGGRIQKAPVCILHTVGCKSGKRRETPLLYLADGDKVVLVASAGGRRRRRPGTTTCARWTPPRSRSSAAARR